jgi:hypothetical protein
MVDPARRNGLLWDTILGEHGPGRGDTRANVPVDVSAAALVDLVRQLGAD